MTEPFARDYKPRILWRLQRGEHVGWSNPSALKMMRSATLLGCGPLWEGAVDFGRPSGSTLTDRRSPPEKQPRAAAAAEHHQQSTEILVATSNGFAFWVDQTSVMAPSPSAALPRDTRRPDFRLICLAARRAAHCGVPLELRPVRRLTCSLLGARGSRFGRRKVPVAPAAHDRASWISSTQNGQRFNGTSPFGFSRTKTKVGRQPTSRASNCIAASRSVAWIRER